MGSHYPAGLSLPTKDSGLLASFFLSLSRRLVLGRRPTTLLSSVWVCCPQDGLLTVPPALCLPETLPRCPPGSVFQHHTLETRPHPCCQRRLGERRWGFSYLAPSWVSCLMRSMEEDSQQRFQNTEKPAHEKLAQLRCELLDSCDGGIG